MVKKNKIHIFGDSFAFGHNQDKFFPSYNIWRELKGTEILPPEWFVILSQNLKCDYQNYAHMGASNDSIFHQFVDAINNFNENDIVILNWTYLHRFRWGSDIKEHKNGYLDISVSFGEPKEIKKNFSDLTKNQILYNRSTQHIWIRDILNYTKVISNLLDCRKVKVFFWDTDGNILNKLSDYYLNPIYLCNNQILKNVVTTNYMFDDTETCDFFKLIRFYGGGTISYETNGFVPDIVHLGEEGHRIQAELFYNHIKKYI